MTPMLSLMQQLAVCLSQVSENEFNEELLQSSWCTLLVVNLKFNFILIYANTNFVSAIFSAAFSAQLEKDILLIESFLCIVIKNFLSHNST